MRLRRWPDDDEHFDRAEDALLEMSTRPKFRERDRLGRELWRSGREDGQMRWVVDPRPHPGGSLPRVIYVGFGRPPEAFWTP